MISDDKHSQLERNYVAFMKVLPTLLPDHSGEYALMRHGAVIEYFHSAVAALSHGRTIYDDDLFSVQEVTTRTADFGWHSRAPVNTPL